jgi:hypothetical protein
MPHQDEPSAAEAPQAEPAPAEPLDAAHALENAGGNADGQVGQLQRIWNFVNGLLPQDDPLRQAIAWLLAFFAVVGLFLGPAALLGTARAATAFIVVLLAILIIVLLVNLVHALSVGTLGWRPRLYSLLRAGLAALVVATIFLAADPVKWIVARDIPLSTLAWLKRLGWLTLAEAVSVVPPRYEPGEIHDAYGLLSEYRVDRSASPVSRPPGTAPIVEPGLLLQALSTRNRLDISGRIFIADNPIDSGVIVLLGARVVHVADGTLLEVGKSKIVIVAETLEIGNRDEHSARIVAYRRPDQDGTASLGHSGQRGPDAGDINIIVSKEMRGGTLQVDLRGADGDNGRTGSVGDPGEPFVPERTPRNAAGLRVQFDTDQNREAARIAVARFRRGEDGREPCRPEAQCNSVLKNIENWLSLCDRIQGPSPCPSDALLFCIHTADPGPDVQDITKYRGGDGRAGEDGGDGGNGGTLIVIGEGIAGLPHISLVPAPASGKAHAFRDHQEKHRQGGPKEPRAAMAEQALHTKNIDILLARRFDNRTLP